MALAETAHSRLVAGLKVLLPLTALVLLSTVFLLSRSTTDEPELTFFDDPEAIPERDTVTAPYYTGSTPEGHAVAITADSARPMPDDPAGVLADRLAASFRLTDGSRISVTADSAAVNEPADQMVLSGEVVIDSSTGYVLRTPELRSALRTIRADAPRGVTGRGPVGDLSAGSLRIREIGPEAAVQLIFTNGVKLVYQPARQSPEEGDAP